MYKSIRKPHVLKFRKKIKMGQQNTIPEKMWMPTACITNHNKMISSGFRNVEPNIFPLKCRSNGDALQTLKCLEEGKFQQ